MKEVNVEIQSTAPLLMNKYSKSDSKKTQTEYIPKEEAEECAYKDDGKYYAPSSWLEASLREAAKGFKGKKKASLKAVILSSVFVEPEKIYFDKNYDGIDSRFARIQREGIIRSRPRWNSWKLKFLLKFDEDRISKDTLKEILIEAGAIKGIGDYRPKFGRFEVMKFTEKK